MALPTTLPLPYLNPKLGLKVTSRTIPWKEMAIRAWGSEFAAPDHQIYVFSNGRSFDSTDRLQTGIYRLPGGVGVGLTSDNAVVTADTTHYRTGGGT